MVQQAHFHWLASSFIQFSLYHNGMQNFLGGYHISYEHFVWGTKYPDITYWDTKKWEAKCPMTPPLVGHRPQGAPPWLRNGLAVE